MASQLDLDQGGTSRAWTKQYLGPSVGWVSVPTNNVLAITASGTFTIDPSTSLVTVNTTGVPVIVLPSAVDPSVPAGALPGLFANNPITIVDIGGNASTHPILIQPVSVSETIMGLASVQIAVDFGGFVLTPSSIQRKWLIL